MGGSVVVSQSDETFSRHEAPKSGREVVGTVGHSKKDRGIKTVKTWQDIDLSVPHVGKV